MAPFYLLTKMDPIGGFYGITVLGVLSVGSIYFVFSRLHGPRSGLIATFMYAVSFYMIFNDREVVPTMMVMMWTVWFYYTLNLFLKGEKKAYLILGVLIGFIWHLNMALVLLMPLVPLAIIVSKKRLNFLYSALGLLTLSVPSVPLILFELRHNFSQVRHLFLSLTTTQSAVFTMTERFGRVIELAGKNLKAFLVPGTPEFPKIYLLAAILVLLGVLIYKKIIDRNLGVVMSAWIILYIVFFTIYSMVLSEYYLNGLAIIWLAIVTIALNRLLSFDDWRQKLGVVLLSGYFLVNHLAFANVSINQSGYIQKKDIIAYIDQDRAGRGYSCISISYITEPGYDFGYRYFFWLKGMHVNAPKSGAPVYSIVFPVSKVDRVDKEFGALGLIFPDYKKYNMSNVIKSCSGANSNVTDSMFGYTE
jgi:4-amino-4-deoxy-L-arabinose transferase-like glycosyltransferase